MNISKGKVYMFTGDGKGKTSAALGVAVRMLCLGKRVLWVSWYKNADWDISEGKLVEKFPDNLTMVWGGRGFYFKNSKNQKLKNTRDVNGALVHDFDTPEGHKRAAEDALGIISDTLGGYDLVVMDEVVNAISDGLIREDVVSKMIRGRGMVNVVLTGRGNLEKIIPQCDLISEVKKIKHPYDNGGLAVRGLDY